MSNLSRTGSGVAPRRGMGGARLGWLVLAGVALMLAMTPSSRAANQTACTAIKLCYCINGDLKATLDAKIAALRSQVAAERAKGKAIGYVSTPLSTLGGGHINLNRDVSDDVKARLERRLGEEQVWVLSPALAEAELAGGKGADYMFMWTSVLEGEKGLGENFDFFYFVGPADFARYLQLEGRNDLKKVETYFDNRLKHDPELKAAVAQGKLNRRQFRDYYGLRGSVAFSSGAHDEWNILRLLNERRRADKDYGVGNQLPGFFEGRALTSADLEREVSRGNVGACGR
jgi:hypothetical protein